MTDYTVTFETAERSDNLGGERLDALLRELEPWHVAVGTSPHGFVETRMTVPADDLLQAVAVARVAIASTGHSPTRVEVIEHDLGEAREEDERIPDLVDPPEAARIIGVSRPAVVGMIERGELVHAPLGQRATAILRSSAERLRDARAVR